MAMLLEGNERAMDDAYRGMSDEPQARRTAAAHSRAVTKTSVLQSGKTESMRVDITPIMDDDLAAVAEFLQVNLNDQVPWERACATVPWKVDAPNYGFMLLNGQRVVGVLLALYSERCLDGRPERFCNMGSWCVLPEFRPRSMSLLQALLAQENYHFTVLTADVEPQEILAWWGFRYLDTSAVLVPNLPWPTAPGRTTVSADPTVIERTLTGVELDLYNDHRHALAAHHLVIIRGSRHCYVMYRKSRYKNEPVALLLHVSNPELLRRAWAPMTRHLLIRQRLLATLAELRFVGCKPPLAFPLTSWPKMYRSATLAPEQIDDLYSELACVPW